jgi:methyl-accepting chemotaxis protein
MRNLTIGKKITFGFVLLFSLLAGVAVVAYTALGGAGRGFKLFANSAQETYLAASLELSMQTMRLHLTEFLTSGSVEDIARAEASIKKLETDLANVSRFTVDAARSRDIAKASELLAAYRVAFSDLVANHRARTTLETEVLNPQARILADGLQEMLAQARKQGDLNAAFQISNGLKAFFESSSLVNSFLLTGDPSKAKGAHEAIQTTVGQVQRMQRDQVEMEKLDASLKDAAKNALLDKLLVAAASYTDGLDRVLAGNQARSQILSERINVIGGEFTSTRQEQTRNELMVLTLTLAGIALGVICGWLIIRGVSRGITAIAARLASESNKAHASAAQVAQASQSMAEGATQQAASLQETSSSLHEMASMTQRNSENAQNAKSLANQARQTADAGATEMEQMKSAMSAIKDSSVDISKIIKTIDEIAFQTTILALNAAVEAARAGEAGLGFAVVADEVRNLAQRCAGAARETAEKISASTEKSEQGVRISEKMATNLAAIVEKTRQLDERIGEIAQSSHEQSEGIGQLNSAVANMDKITQDNAALSQQSASASEELREQAESVREAVGELMRMAQNSPPAPDPKEAKSSARRGVVSPRLSSPRNGSSQNGHDSHPETNGRNGHQGQNGHSSQNGHNGSNGHGASGTNGSGGGGYHHGRRGALASFASSSDDLSFKDHD